MQGSRIEGSVLTLGLDLGAEREVIAEAVRLAGERTSRGASKFTGASIEALAWAALGIVRRRRLAEGGEDLLWEIKAPIPVELIGGAS